MAKRKYEYRDICGYPMVATPKQLDEISELLSREDYRNPRFKKYFNVWISTNNTGVYWFPKEQYYAYQGSRYVADLVHYAGDSLS